MKNFNFTFSPSEDETKGLIPRSMLRDSGSGLAPRFNAPLLPSEASDLPASAISQLAEADAFLELILYREREMILFLSFYLYGAALAGGNENWFSLPIRQLAEQVPKISERSEVRFSMIPLVCDC